MLDILGRRVQMFIGVSGMVATLLLIGGLIKRESALLDYRTLGSADTNDYLIIKATDRAPTHPASTVLLLSSFSSKGSMHSPSPL